MVRASPFLEARAAKKLQVPALPGVYGVYRKHTRFVAARLVKRGLAVVLPYLVKLLIPALVTQRVLQSQTLLVRKKT